MTGTLAVYVPTGEASALAATVLRGSAIVGCVTDSHERMLVHYEGDRYGSGADFRRRLDQAAGRLIERYPTVACATVATDDVQQVGTYDADWRRLDITDADALAAWLDTTVEQLEEALGTPRPPAPVARDDPHYLQRLSARVIAGAPLSGSEVHDLEVRFTHLTQEAQQLLRGGQAR